jgi:hypothetical protein
VGTSRALRGPRSSAWSRAATIGRKCSEAASGEPDAFSDISGLVEAGRAALTEDLRADSEQFGLMSAMFVAGDRLVNVLEHLLCDGLSVLLPTDAEPDMDTLDLIYVQFVEQVAGHGNLVTDSAVRRAAARCADVLTAPDGPVAAAVQRGEAGGQRISGELFCLLYDLFFGEVVGQFLKTMITAKIQLAVPVLPVLPFGAGHEIASWAAERVVGLIPNPCEEREQPGNEGETLADLGRKLLGDVIRQSLGLDTAPGTDQSPPSALPGG